MSVPDDEIYVSFYSTRPEVSGNDIADEIECGHCDSREPCFDGSSMAGYPCQHPTLSARRARINKRVEWLQKMQALIGSAEEAERLLTFAFEDGALPNETVLGLCVDPYGLLRDLRLALLAVGGATSKPGG